MPAEVSRRGFLIGLGAAFGLAATGEATRQHVFEQDPGPDTAIEASENFFRLQQTVFNGLGPETEFETPPGQYGKSFIVGGREYALFLDKEVEGMPNRPGNKRTVVINDREQRSEYFMIDENTVYQQETLSVFNPLDLSQITELSERIEEDFERWQEEMPNQASVSV